MKQKLTIIERNISLLIVKIVINICLVEKKNSKIYLENYFCCHIVSNIAIILKLLYSW